MISGRHLEGNIFLFSIISKDKPTVIGKILEQLDRDENKDGNGVEDGNWDWNEGVNGQGGIPKMDDLTQGHPRDDDEILWDDIVTSIDEVQVVGQLRNK